MANAQDKTKTGESPADEKPKRSRLRQILDEKPEERPRLGKAIFALLSTTLASLAVIGVLLIWHIKRRAALMRERLSPPRPVAPLELPGQEADPIS